MSISPVQSLGAQSNWSGRRERLGSSLARAVRGEVKFDNWTRAVYATDSSNYRHVPLGVVCPLDEKDVVETLRICADVDAPVLARGAGTSLAGQACNQAVVLDTSRHMTAILEVDSVTQRARVQPGVVLDNLRAAAEEFGLTFGPDPATHAWCTIGGMIGNNACGSHSLYAGKTQDNVAELTVATYGGTILTLSSYEEEVLNRIIAEGGHLGDLLGRLRSLRDDHEELIRGGFPALPRRVSGYNLDELLPERGFNVARALVGTESTCAVVTEAVVHLSASPAHRRLVVLSYDDAFAAADHVPALIRHPLLALEGFDGSLVGQMHSSSVGLDAVDLLPAGGAWLVAELGGTSAREADSRAEEFVASLAGSVEWRRYDRRSDQRSVWRIREASLAAAARTAGLGRNHEGWEDAAVPPEHLGTYMRALSGLWKEYGYSGAWYGHFGQGCVHTRNDFDFSTSSGVASYRQYIERAAELVVALGGSLSGEHGDGQARGELLEKMFGGEMVGAFRRFKAAFDPRGRMNPGRVIDALPFDSNLRFGPQYRTGLSTDAHREHDGRSLQRSVERCVGVGRCRSESIGGMCPSFRATREEVHSTRGRAKILSEMFQGELTPSRWRNEDVRDALDLCLSCKACAVECPTGVDMAAYKAEFLSHYYEGRLRPRSTYALSLLPWGVRLFARAPGIPNAFLGAPGVGRALCRLAGITTERTVPRLAGRPFRRGSMADARRDDTQASVVVWPDTFTNAFRPQIAEDVVAVLEATGERVTIPSSWGCCGRPLFDAGMLGLARRTFLNLLTVLNPWVERGVPVVIAEPSCLASLRDELPRLLGDDARAVRLAQLARSPAEHLRASNGLAALLAQSPRESRPSSPAGRVVIHPHCHARAIDSPESDVAVLEQLGIQTTVVDAGCCGLAGSFGYRSDHAALSRQIGQAQWLPQIEAALTSAGSSTDLEGPMSLVVDGFSCSLQLSELSDLQGIPLVTLVREHLGC
jgi:FAD/FMN-containing dehydrogenase/Fe-S oxidoreductase